MVVDVGGLVSVLSARGVEKRLARLTGVQKVEANYVAGSATVVFDETHTDLAAIKNAVHECGYHCAGERLPRHVCVPDDPPGEATAHTEHAAHAAPADARDEMAHEMGHGGAMDMQAMVRDMRNRFWICLAFTLPIFVYSPMGDLFEPPPPPFGLDLGVWLFALASLAVIYPGAPRRDTRASRGGRRGLTAFLGTVGA